MASRQARQAQQVARLKALRFGVEIEVLGSERSARDAIRSVVAPGTSESRYGERSVRAADGREWKVVYDGSVGSAGCEVVSPILRYEDIEIIQDIVRALRRLGCRVDSRCGIHVHVDAADFDAGALTRLAKMVHRQEDLIIAALGVLPERMESYARKVDTRFIQQVAGSRVRSMRTLNRMWYGSYTSHASHYDGSRYRGLNLHAVWYHGTVEFRYFNGTLHAGKVKAYIQLCLALAAKALTMTGASFGHHNFNPATGRYDMRVFLLRLGLRGEEFATARHHLLCNLRGARSRGRLARRAATRLPSPSIIARLF